jgi:hypothetical protein
MSDATDLITVEWTPLNEGATFDVYANRPDRRRIHTLAMVYPGSRGVGFGWHVYDALILNGDAPDLESAKAAVAAALATPPAETPT